MDDLELERQPLNASRTAASGRGGRTVYCGAATALALLAATLLLSGVLRGPTPADVRSGQELAKTAAGQGGCDFGVNCAETSCCTHAGFACVEQNEWWSSCESSGSGDTPSPSPPPQENCSAAGEDCTETDCCADPNYHCAKRTDGMWWKSTCKEGAPDDEGDHSGGGGGEDSADVAGGGAGGILKPHTCGQDMPDDDVLGQWKVAEQCADKLLKNMSRQDKLSLLHGSPGGMGFAGMIKPTGLAGPDGGEIRITMNDGPQGYNGYTPATDSKSTQYPDLVALAASWDPEVATLFGKAISEEFRAKGCFVLLGPDVEIVRAPLSGRTFESLSGEDPYLGSQLAAAYVREVHQHGLIATAKHWLNNEQENNRQELNVEVSDRAQQEIYLPPFKAAIEAGAGAVMCSYNKVYGDYACENDKLLNKLLREDLNFKGFVVSDWGAVHSGAKSANNGLNVEMPEAKYFQNLGDVSDSTVDKLAKGVLSAVYAAGQFHGKGPQLKWQWPPPFYQDTTSDEHRSVARRIITEGAVLLKNEGVLPLKAGAKVMMLGKACMSGQDPSLGQGNAYSAGGSGFVSTTRTVSPLKGLQALLGEAAVGWGEAASAAEGSDVAIICGTSHEEEGKDRTSLEMPGVRDLVRDLKGKAAKIVVVAIAPGAVDTEWVSDVAAALVLFSPGEQIGAALADLLTGASSPGGRLPVTFPKPTEKRFALSQYPGENLKSDFSEGVLVGYRWNDAKQTEPAFPFGYGLTYTSFEFSDLDASCATDGKGGAGVRLTVSNTGAREGAAVPQVYVGFAGLQPVVRQLRAFRKVTLKPGTKTEVAFGLTEDDWKFYDETAQAWKSATGLGQSVVVSVGTSSGNISWSKTITCLPPSPAARL